MGITYAAECVCGYRVDRLYVGGGMRYDERGEFRIVRCPTCAKIFSERRKVGNCGVCHAPLREIVLGKPGVPVTGPEVSTDQECPACGKKNLVFRVAGLFD